jgi:hypothetical protein
MPWVIFPGIIYYYLKARLWESGFKFPSWHVSV